MREAAGIESLVCLLGIGHGVLVAVGAAATLCNLSEGNYVRAQLIPSQLRYQ